MELRAPFPWFGGKSRISAQVWERLGNPPNYVEPFAGSLAVLLRRPRGAGLNETVNDLDAYLSNFWRAVSADPEAVAAFADWPVSEADLHARHLWLVKQTEFRERMLTDPEFYDPRIAGWWVWGISQWIGSGWCSRPEWTGRTRKKAAGINAAGVKGKRPLIGKAGHGVSSNLVSEVHRKVPYIDTGGRGVFRQLPHLMGDQGIFKVRPTLQRGGQGTNSPCLAEGGIYELFRELMERLARVRVCCGDWRRVLGPTPTTHIGLTAVFLDPPYDMRVVNGPVPGRGGGASRLYTTHSNDVSGEVREWALSHGSNPLLRIALCGYEGEHEFPRDWECVAWRAPGGYANQGGERDKDNSARERIWFSPACIRPQELLFPDEANWVSVAS